MKLEQKIPPVAVFLLSAFFMVVTTKVARNVSVEYQYKFETLILFLLLGVGIAVIGVVSFKKHKTSVHPIKTERVVSLVTSGVYQYSRNPMCSKPILPLAQVYGGKNRLSLTTPKPSFPILLN
jgi:protein-S-isoprenylcysteine O-methyltransferase Ste14